MKKLFSVIMIILMLSFSGVVATSADDSTTLEKVREVVAESANVDVNDQEVTVTFVYNRLSNASAEKLIKDVKADHNTACKLSIAQKKLPNNQVQFGYITTTGMIIAD